MANLSSKFNVQDIHSLIILDGDTGKVITSEGHNAIMEDPEGQGFPWISWKPKSLKRKMEESGGKRAKVARSSRSKASLEEVSMLSRLDESDNIITSNGRGADDQV